MSALPDLNKTFIVGVGEFAEDRLRPCDWVAPSHSASTINVGALISDGSHKGFPVIQYSRVSWTVPLGVRTTGGVCLAPTGSMASVAADHASNHAAGIRSFSSGAPFCRRLLACSIVHV